MTSEAELFSEAVQVVKQLDASAVRHELYLPGGTHKWPRYRINEVELEWRRWRIRRHLNMSEDPPGSIRLFEQLCVAAGVPAAAPSAVAAQLGGRPLTALSYDEMFPQGPVIAKALKTRVIRDAPLDPTDEEHAMQMLASAQRRDDYLRMLDSQSYWWMISDLISEKTRQDCIKEIVTLPASIGSAYNGGPRPGWDQEHDALVSQSCNAYLGAGPKLIEVHEDAQLVGLISEKMGRRMYPTRCTYLRYRDGDYLGVHTDQPTCEVSLMFTVDGDAGPLRSYFDETANGPEWLHRWVHDSGHFPEGGQDFIYQPREGFALTGRAVPHARLPQYTEAIIGALFYSGLI